MEAFGAAAGEDTNVLSGGCLGIKEKQLPPAETTFLWRCQPLSPIRPALALLFTLLFGGGSASAQTVSLPTVSCTYNPEFSLRKHFSAFIAPGAALSFSPQATSKRLSQRPMSR